MPSQKVREPSPPPVQKVPCVWWKEIVLMGKTFWDPVTAGDPGMDPVGMSIRWHLNEKFFLGVVRTCPVR